MYLQILLCAINNFRTIYKLGEAHTNKLTTQQDIRNYTRTENQPPHEIHTTLQNLSR